MTNAYVHTAIESGSVTSAARHIADLESVSAAHVVTGEYDVIAQIDLDDPNDLPHVVADEIHGVPGVVDTITSVAYEP